MIRWTHTWPTRPDTGDDTGVEPDRAERRLAHHAGRGWGPHGSSWSCWAGIQILRQIAGGSRPGGMDRGPGQDAQPQGGH